MASTKYRDAAIASRALVSDMVPLALSDLANTTRPDAFAWRAQSLGFVHYVLAPVSSTTSNSTSSHCHHTFLSLACVDALKLISFPPISLCRNSGANKRAAISTSCVWLADWVLAIEFVREPSMWAAYILLLQSRLTLSVEPAEKVFGVLTRHRFSPSRLSNSFTAIS